MSSSMIEAKFQQLDRTIKLLKKPNHRPKLASSDQLRELVYNQRVNYAASKMNGVALRTPVPDKHTPSTPPSPSKLSISNQEETQQSENHNRKQPPVRLGVCTSRPRSSVCSGHGASNTASKWIDPKQLRAEQILEDTWNVCRDACYRTQRRSNLTTR